MNMKSSKKLKYVPLKIEITHVALEAMITTSPVQKVDLKDWEYETSDEPGNNKDVILYF